MSILILVRHGESEAQQKQYYSWNEAPLTELGMEQAEQLGEQLKLTPFNYVITSRCHRAKQTAELILEKNYIKPEFYVENELFNERSYGLLERKPKKSIINKFGKPTVDSWTNALHARPPNGESQFMLYNRVVPFFKKEVETRLKQKNINMLLVSHYHVMQAIMSYIEGLRLEDQLQFNPQNCDPIVYNFDVNDETLT